MDLSNFTNKANSHTPKVEVHATRSHNRGPIMAPDATKIMPFRPHCCESEVVLSKKFRSSYPAWSVRMGKFSSRFIAAAASEPEANERGSSLISTEDYIANCRNVRGLGRVSYID